MAVADPCPDCGGPLSLKGRFCKACGWDADLAESEDSYLDGVDVPDTFTEEDYREALGGAGLSWSAGRVRRIAMAVVAVLTALAFLIAFSR